MADALSAQFMAVANQLPTLWNLEEQLLLLTDAFETPDDERTPEQRAAIESLTAMLESKIEGYCEVIRTFQVLADARDAEAARLTAKAKSHTSVVQRLKERLAAHMALTGQTRIVTTRYTLDRRSYAHVEVLDASAVPIDYHRRRVDDSVDKAAVLKAYRERKEHVDGTEIVFEDRVVIS
jgi:Siphovirus Gp157